MQFATVYTIVYTCLALLVLKSEQRTKNYVSHQGTGVILQNGYLKTYKSKLLQASVQTQWYTAIVYRYDVDENSNFMLDYTVDNCDGDAGSASPRSVNFCYTDEGEKTQDGTLTTLMRKILGIRGNCPISKDVYDLTYIEFSLENEDLVFDDDSAKSCRKINIKLHDSKSPPTDIYEGSLIISDGS